MKFTDQDLKKLWKPREDSSGEDNGQITIIGGSELFTGAPLLSLIAASRLVDMVFVATPTEDKEIVSKIALFSKLRSVIWIPKEDLDVYIEKSDAILIGPGLMRYHKSISDDHVLDGAGTDTKMLTKYLLTKFARKKWVIDGGSLQVLDPKWIPKRAIVTPNKHEYEMLTNTSPLSFPSPNLGEGFAEKYECIVVNKGQVTYVTDGETTYEIDGGNAGLTKGGTGDTLAGIITGLFAKNDGLLAAAAGTYILKKTAEVLYEKVGYNFNADDVAENVFEVFEKLRNP